MISASVVSHPGNSRREALVFTKLVVHTLTDMVCITASLLVRPEQLERDGRGVCNPADSQMHTTRFLSFCHFCDEVYIGRENKVLSAVNLELSQILFFS